MNQTNVRAQIEALKVRRRQLTEEWSRLYNGVPDSLNYDTRTVDKKQDLPITPARIAQAKSDLDACELQLKILTEQVAPELLRQMQTEWADEATEQIRWRVMK